MLSLDHTLADVQPPLLAFNSDVRILSLLLPNPAVDLGVDFDHLFDRFVDVALQSASLAGQRTQK